MISYKIIRVDAVNLQLQVRYSRDNFPDYYVNIGMVEGFTEEDVHNRARDTAKDAEWHWSRMGNVLELENDSGEVKDIVFEVRPRVDERLYTVSEEKTETDTTITYGWKVWEKTTEQIAGDVRSQRNALLRLTDHYAFQDRSMSKEMREYRQALRDISQQEGFPTEVVWPIAPLMD